MKYFKIIVILFVIGMYTNSFAQVIYNNSFEEYCQTNYSEPSPFYNSCPGTSCSAWPSCVPGWKSSHGSPNIAGSAYNGSNCAEMWSAYSSDSSRVIGEGIFTNVCFSHDATYFISLWVKGIMNQKFGELYIYAASNLTQRGLLTQGERIPTIDGELLYQGDINSSSWQQVLINYTPNASVPVRNQLVIFPYQSDPLNAYVFIDKVEVFKTSCCPSSVLYQNTNTLPAYTNVSDYIRAGNNVGSTYASTGDVDFGPGHTTTMKAGNYVSLEPGFTAEYGSVMTASIAVCTSATNCNYNSTCQDNTRLGIAPILFENTETIVEDMRIYPNPTTGKLYIDLLPAKYIAISIYNMIGEVLYQKEYKDLSYSSKEIDVNTLSTGVYRIEIIKDGTKQVKTFSIVK
ncbi:MAG TPA: T9SS type A sorting domain-containing protein [Cytophagaceae bacterium]|nr:T9SS type A sorting domain-containing protein [Cytophagaceae bacterium]